MPRHRDGQDCLTDLSVLGSRVAPGRCCPYTVTVSTIISAILLIFVGAIADRSPHPTRLFGRLRLGRGGRRAR